MKNLNNFVNNLSDKELYIECKKRGLASLQARWKFEGLLPEVNKRESKARLNGNSWLQKRGYGSIFEFAAKLAGMSHDQVLRVLQLERKFADKLILKESLTKGEVSVNKLARIASIASVENQKELLEKAKVLSKNALEAFVRDVKFEDHNASIKPLFTSEAAPGHRILLSEEVHEKLYRLKEKGIDVNQLILEFLNKRDEEIAIEKEKLAEEEVAAVQEKLAHEEIAAVKETLAHKEIAETRDSAYESGNKQPLHLPDSPKPSRYINARINRIIHLEHGIKCSVPYCNQSALHIHHEKPFAIHKSHDPRYLKPLCKGHHELRHLGDPQVQKFRQSVH